MPDFAALSWRSHDGLALFARDYAGAGSADRLPVICLHGLTRNSRDFEELAPVLAADGRRVIVPDTRGRGRSQWSVDPASYHPKVYARDIADLLDQAGIARAIFLGTSMGGLIMMALAAKRSMAIAAAILNDVGPEVDPAGIARITSYAGLGGEVGSWDDAAAYARTINQIAFPRYGDSDWRKVARRLFREEENAIVPDYDPAIAQVLAKPVPRFAKLVAWLLFRRLARKRPTLLIRGENSDVITGDIAERMKKAAPAMELTGVPGVGHAPDLSEPVALESIREFLARQP